MERIHLSLFHSKNTFLYLASGMLERMAFYGFRAIFVLYMTGETLELERSDALEIYGWFTFGMLFANIFGASISDFIIGNKTGLLTGGILQVVGAIVVWYPSITGLYIGIVLFILGEGFYTPNIKAQYGKLYLNKTKLLDAAFTFFFLVLNIGAIFAPVIIGGIAEIDFTYGFTGVAILAFGAVIFLLFVQDDVPIKQIGADIKFKNRIQAIISAFVIVGLFWAIYEFASKGLYNLQVNYSGFSDLNFPKTFLYALNSAFTIPIGIFCLVLWSFFYYSQIVKLTIGFGLTAISFALLLFLTEIPGTSNIFIFACSMFLLSIAETHIYPVTLSIATKYANPKYLATILSLSIIPGRLLMYLSGLLILIEFESPILYFSVGAISMGLIGIGLLVYLLIFVRKGATNHEG